jgi:hypothetical protein
VAAPPASTAGQPHPASSLTEWLRGRDDAALAGLLRRRPDLSLPAPADLATLASRLSVRASVQRAVDSLDAFTLRVLDALVLAAGDVGETTLAAAAALTGELGSGELERAVADLLDLALIWGDPARLHLVATVRESLGTYPSGLGRPAAVLLRQVSDVQLAPVLRSFGLPAASQPRAGTTAATVLADPSRVAELVAACDPAEREILDRLAAGPPVGTVRNAHLPASRPDMPPPHRLIARGLLVPIDAQTVELPREVGVALRPAAVGRVESRPPAIPVVERGTADLDRLGTTAVLETLRLVEALGRTWTDHPPPLLRAGGVGVRELRRTARDLGVDEATTALIAETAAAAGLVNASHGAEPVYLPTAEFDDWQAKASAAGRWADLATAWLAMTRQPGLVGHRSDRDRVIAVLSPDAERGTVPALRAQILAALVELPPGAAPGDRTDVLRRLTWQAPRRAGNQRGLAESVLAEADLLGVTAAGGLTGYSRTLLAGSRPDAERVLMGVLPEPVDHFVVQPDLTIVVPGPPTAELARELALAADLESTGGASVYRITEASVRRAFDAGRSGAELSALVTQRSRTPVPQALSYLIEDVARRHGRLRTGAAGAYLRCDDEALLARVLADRDTAVLRLRRIAPTVAVSSAAPHRMLDVLRQSGYAPAAETPDGAVIALDAEAPRAPSRTPTRPGRQNAAAQAQGQLTELVRRVRSGDALTQLSRRVPPIAQQVPGVTSASTMALLRDAIREGRRVLLGCAEPDGTATRHTIVPISLGGGFVRGHEPATQRLQSFPLHRITAASVIGDPEPLGDDSA